MMGNRDPLTSLPWSDGPTSLPGAGALQKARKPAIPTKGGSVPTNSLGPSNDADSISLGLGLG